MAKAGNLKLDFMAKSIGIHFFEFEDMFRCYRDNENLKKHFGHMDTLNLPNHSKQPMAVCGLSVATSRKYRGKPKNWFHVGRDNMNVRLAWCRDYLKGSFKLKSSLTNINEFNENYNGNGIICGCNHYINN